MLAGTQELTLKLAIGRRIVGEHMLKQRAGNRARVFTHSLGQGEQPRHRWIAQRYSE